MSVESLFNTNATVLRFVPADGSWGSADGYEESGIIPCRLRALSGREYGDGKARGEASHRAYLPSGTAIAAKDRLRIGATIYEIIPPINDAGGGAGHHMEADLKEHVR